MDSLEQTSELKNTTAIEIINTTKTLLPDEIINGTMIMNGVEVPVSVYMDTFLIKIVKENTTPDMIANIIKTKFSEKIIKAISDSKKREIAEEFLRTREDSGIYYSNTKTLGEEFIERAVLYMGNDLLFRVGPNKKTIEEYYEIIKNNISKGYTKEEQIESYEYYMESIFDEEILNSIKIGTDITVREFILNELASTEEEYIYVTYNGRKMQIDEALVTIREEQLEFINANIEVPELKTSETIQVEEVNTRTNENPSNVGEIIYRVEADKSVTVSTDTPFTPNRELTEEELYNIYVTNEAKSSQILTTLNLLMDAVNKTNSHHDLENLEKEFTEIANEIAISSDDKYIIEKLNALQELIISKKRHIIKVEGNKSYYVESLEDQIAYHLNELKGYEDLKQIDTEYGISIGIQRDIQTKGLRDYELEGSVEKLNQDILLKRIIIDNTMPNQNKDLERLIAEIEDRIKDIEQMIYEMNTSKNEASIAGLSIRVESDYKELSALITGASNEGILTQEQSEEYFNRLNIVLGFEQEVRIKNR